MSNLFTINGQDYSCEKIDAMRQFHIVRRLAPVLAAAIPSGFTLARMKEMGDVPIDAVLPKLADALSKMSDDDANVVIIELLKPVRRKEAQGLGWSPLVQGGAIMYQDLKLPDMLQIAFHSARLNLQDFSSALPQILNGANQKANAQ